MIPVETLTAFFAAAVLLALAPGPDNIFVLTQSALHGRVSGVAVVLGLCTGLVGHTLAVALGVAVIFQASAVAFTVLKLAGAAYLLYLAWQAFRAPAARLAAADGGTVPFGRLYRRGIIMNLTNPKVSLFFLAFLPQFVRPGAGDELAQLLGLSATFMLMTFVIFAIYGLLAHAFRKAVVESQQVQAWLRRGFAASFAGLGANLALADR